MRERSGVFVQTKSQQLPTTNKHIECFISHEAMERATQPVIAPPISSLSEPESEAASQSGLERTIQPEHITYRYPIEC